MALKFGEIRRMCPYCCEDIDWGHGYEVADAIEGSPINGMTIHTKCAEQRRFAAQSSPHSNLAQNERSQT